MTLLHTKFSHIAQVVELPNINKVYDNGVQSPQSWATKWTIAGQINDSQDLINKKLQKKQQQI